MAGTATIQKKSVYDGTKRSALQIIFERTFGNILVQISLVIICIIWTVPTAGLFISSLRTEYDINNSGWWTILSGAGEIEDDLGIQVLSPDAQPESGTEVPAGGTLSFNTEESRLLQGAASGVPAPTIETYGISEIESTLEIPEYGQPVDVADIGSVLVNEDESFEFTPAEGFDGYFDADVDIDEDTELPLTIEYSLEGKVTETETIEVDMGTMEDDVEVEAYGEPVEVDDFGTLVVNEDGSFDFTTSESYDGTFEADIPGDVEPPFDVVYRVEPYGQEITIPRTGSVIVNRDGTSEFISREGTPRDLINLNIDEEDAAELPFRIEYTLERPGGYLYGGSAGEPVEAPGFGTFNVQPDGSYEFQAADGFNGELELTYNIQNPLLTLDNYDTVIFGDQDNDDLMGVAFINSLTVAVPATIIPITLAAFASYAFSWMEFPFRRFLFFGVVGLMVVPLQLAFIPLLRVYTTLDLNGTFVGLWLAHTGFGMPLAVFLLRNYIANLPRELIESAAIDGASHFTIFMRLILPLSVPALASFAIFQFLWVWNDLLVALVFLGNTPVVTSMLSEMVGSRGQDWYVLTSGAFVSMVVPLIVFFSLQRYFVRGMLGGSIKGG